MVMGEDLRGEGAMVREGLRRREGGRGMRSFMNCSTWRAPPAFAIARQYLPFWDRFDSNRQIGLTISI